MSCYHCPDVRIARKEAGLVAGLLRDVTNVTVHIETQVTIDEDEFNTDYAEQRELLDAAVQYIKEAEERLENIRETLILRHQRLEKAAIPPLTTSPPKTRDILSNIKHTVVSSEK